MNEREKIIQLWFEMWLTKQDLGIDNMLRPSCFVQK